MADDTPLGRIVNGLIVADGPMPVSTYMRLCLTHPRFGYYVSGDPLGLGGDFVTAPEISQMFGELIGFFFVNLWQQLGEPASFTLLELGPGRGTLMEDFLRAAGRAPGFTDALHLQLFESNATLRAEQDRRLGAYSPYWASDVDAVADDPLFVVANEFFDALPVTQHQMRAGRWHERQVGLLDGRRAFGLSPTPSPFHQPAEDGAIVESRPDAAAIFSRLARRIADQGGAFLAIDYGYAGPAFGDTLQALRGHAPVDPLEHPGTSDLTAHVDFTPLAEAAVSAGLSAAPFATQGDFLRRLGIDQRAAALSNANPDQADDIAAATRRLTASDDMGDLFKVLCACSPGLRPEGFA